VQRLFSTFADGWPGIGLLLLRLLTVVALVYFGMAGLREAPQLATVAVQILGISAGILLLVGLWTLVAGALVALVQMSLAFSEYFSHFYDLWIPVILAALGAALAVVGPSAWSVDARLFGRKCIDIPEL